MDYFFAYLRVNHAIFQTRKLTQVKKSRQKYDFFTILFVFYKYFVNFARCKPKRLFCAVL